jgi:protein-disulfide isomerase
MESSRRRFLALAAAGAGVLAGCTDASAPGGTGDGLLGGHPAAQAIESQPRLGPPLAEATAVVVAFEDPSCTTCGRFERTTFPKLKADLVDPGTAAFVYRGVPVVYPWGEPAVQALESTYARDEAAFWALKDHYYAEQDAFTPENTLDRTGEFLASETELDAAAVVADAREKRHDDAVQADLSASSAAGASGVPTFFLFRDGSFRTSITGAQSFDVFASALEV